MTPDPLAESLRKLEDRYQILTELHHCGESRTYLARHLELNRDVTITVARANSDKAFLNAYAADAEILKTKRHPNIMPVLEGTWLDDDTFAVVRARVRGSTLDQTAERGRQDAAGSHRGRTQRAHDGAHLGARRRHHQPLRRAGDVRLPAGQRTRAARLRAVGAHRRRRRDDRIDRTRAERRRLPRRQRIHRAARRTAQVDARRRSPRRRSLRRPTKDEPRTAKSWYRSAATPP